MTFKQLLDKVSYEDIAPYIHQAVSDNDNDLRPNEVKLGEIEQGFKAMKAMKPTFGHIDSRIDVKMINGHLNVSNTHLGSTSDLLSHQLNISSEVTASETEIAAQCVFQIVAHASSWQHYRDEDDFDDLDNPQTARNLR
ncbi:MAG: hypothetical protein I3J02_11445 [Prevotella sp.]|nr:hypothetical protein [Prevotella sp.]